MQMNICIDIDGTVTEPNYWIPMANKYFEKNVKSKDVTVYEINDVLGVTQKEYDKFYELYGETLHRRSKIRPGAKEVISILNTYNNIHFVTAREEKMRNVTIEWLKGHQIQMDSISLLGSNNKIHKAKELSSNLFIEDRYENAISLSQSGFDVLLIDCNYNKGILPANVQRIKHWYEILNIVENLSQKHCNRYKLA